MLSRAQALRVKREEIIVAEKEKLVRSANQDPRPQQERDSVLVGLR